jgi:Mn2+/Fe2+ NRAMP family transporter
VLAAVVGPGLLAGLSDDDPAGITTYSIAGADYGYRLLWVLLLATGALIVFHELAARMGIATGQGLAGLVRERFGVRLAGLALVALLVANIGTTCAEFAGVAASLDLLGVSRYLSVPVAAIAVSTLVLRGSFHRVERVLLALGAVFATYVVSGILAGPDWAAAGRGLAVPSLPGSREAIVTATAVVGTTLAPWGLAFMQSYVVDKRLRPSELRFERVDVISGAVMTGVIGAFVVVACAATLHSSGHSINDASDAARALKPLAGNLASALFGAGLLGAALLAASILPLSTAYSVAEAFGTEAELDDPLREAPLFYGTYAVTVVIAVAVVLVPGISLIPILFLTQVLNAILLLPLLFFMYRLSGDRAVMGELSSGAVGRIVAAVAMALITACVIALGVVAVI